MMTFELFNEMIDLFVKHGFSEDRAIEMASILLSSLSPEECVSFKNDKSFIEAMNYVFS